MAFELEQFKLKWQGRGEIEQAYSKNDIVAWKGKSYRCIRDCPVAYTISGTLWSTRITTLWIL